MSKILLSLTLALSCLLPAHAEGLATITHVVIDGKPHAFTEVDHTRREVISKWNILRLKRGQEYHGYKEYVPQKDGEPLILVHVVDAKTFKKHKKQLTKVPDLRPDEQKHPDFHRVKKVADIVTPVVIAIFDSTIK